jgi:hypothetical protein
MKSISKISLRNSSMESIAKCNQKINPEPTSLGKRELAKNLNIFRKNSKKFFSKSIKPIILNSVQFNFLTTMLLTLHMRKGSQPNFIY